MHFFVRESVQMILESSVGVSQFDTGMSAAVLPALPAVDADRHIEYITRIEQVVRAFKIDDQRAVVVWSGFHMRHYRVAGKAKRFDDAAQEKGQRETGATKPILPKIFPYFIRHAQAGDILMLASKFDDF